MSREILTCAADGRKYYGIRRNDVGRGAGCSLDTPSIGEALWVFSKILLKTDDVRFFKSLEFIGRCKKTCKLEQERKNETLIIL